MNTAARADGLRQMSEIHKQEQIYDVSTAEDFAEMIFDGYDPDKDFMFLQYANDSADRVTCIIKILRNHSKLKLPFCR